MQPFFSIRNFKSHKKMMDSFFGIKNGKIVMVSFFSIKNFKSHKKVIGSFFSGHASLCFHDAQIF